MADTTDSPPFEAIREVLDLLWEDEEADCQEREARGEECSHNHIFYSLVEIRNWLHACGEDRPSARTQAAIDRLGQQARRSRLRWATFAVGIYAGAALLTFGFQTWVRLDQCGTAPCAFSLAKGAVWSAIWPIYWLFWLWVFRPA
jgi:hypothetical protein